MLQIFSLSGMESTSCDRRVYLNQYMNTSHYLIFDGTIGQLHTKFHEEKVDRSYVVKETPNRMYTYYQSIVFCTGNLY